jgi:hypothetical protein
MQVSIIKFLAENYSLIELRKVEEALLNENQPEIEINGNDECEKLTHVLATIEILESMEANKTDLRQCIREFSQRVRNSIS